MTDIIQIPVEVFPDGRMTTVNAARYLGLAPKTLSIWRSEGKGPRFMRYGGRVFYTLEEMERWIDAIPLSESSSQALVISKEKGL